MLKRLETAIAADLTTETVPKKVLVAEDNIVSQQMARDYLEAIGCDVMVVEHGAAAVEACSRHEFGLVLMDLLMPQMDGIQATIEIRRRERPGRHVPILALTARAASEELARCTAAGMNGLLTKPLELARLRQTLDRFGLVRRTAELPPSSPADSRDGASGPMDLLTLWAKFSGDATSLRSHCQVFVTNTARNLEELSRSLAAGERTRVRQIAHKIKGAGSDVYAHRLAAIAANVESESMSSSLGELAAATVALRRAFDEAVNHIRTELP